MSPNFGMCEMETAAEIIVEKAKKCKSWDINIRLSDFGDPDGFLQLLAYGWLEPNYIGGKDEFKVKQNFVKRIEETYGKLDLTPPLQWLTPFEEENILNKIELLQKENKHLRQLLKQSLNHLDQDFNYEGSRDFEKEVRQTVNLEI